MNLFLDALIVVAGVIVLVLGVWFFKSSSNMLNFFATGLDNKFSLSEIAMLWKLAKSTGIDEPLSLYVSDKAISKCVAMIVENAKKNHTENEPKVQQFLSKLYKFRTKVELSADNRRGLKSTRQLDSKQKLRIILKGSGIFSSMIVNNASEIAIMVPVQNGRIAIPANEWIGKDINIYLWRKGDAAYVFDTRVLRSGVFLGRQVLFLRQSEEITRMQKRRSIRTECNINAQFYLIKETVTDFLRIETAPGYKCLIEDISSDGALIRVGGKGVPNVQMKLQFELDETLVVMYGTVRSVEFNQASNQSRLHIECTHIEPNMRNAILTFVYKVIPEEQKNAELAINELRNEEGEDDNASENDDIAENAEAIYKKMNSERVNSKSDDNDVADSLENSFSSLEEAEKFFNAAQSSMKKDEK
ncbi:MAG: PilZ domain-containing protein [Treponema sp.]|nr:PilZ domain-containing protein [Treponema sp.]